MFDTNVYVTVVHSVKIFTFTVIMNSFLKKNKTVNTDIH